MKKQFWSLVFIVCLVISLSSLVFIVVGCGTGIDELPTTTMAGGTTTTVAGGTTTTTVAGGTTTTTTTTTTTLPNFNWTQKTAAAFASGGRYNHRAVVFLNKLWVVGGTTAGGGTNEIWSTPDGQTWTKEGLGQFPAITGHDCVVFNNKIWLIGGQNSGGNTSEVWSSDNGTTWTLATVAPFTGRTAIRCVAYNDGGGEAVWMTGGVPGAGTSEVWKATNSALTAWSKVANSPPFGKRFGHECLVKDNKMWLLCGESQYIMDDVWTSVDGSTWNKVGAVTAFGSPAGTSEVSRARFGAAIFPVNGTDQIFVTGGENNYNGSGARLNDTRFSADGVSWTRVGSTSAYTAREEFTCTAFNGKLWVIGGRDTGGTKLNDVWYSPLP